MKNSTRTNSLSKRLSIRITQEQENLFAQLQEENITPSYLVRYLLDQAIESVKPLEQYN